MMKRREVDVAVVRVQSPCAETSRLPAQYFDGCESRVNWFLRLHADISRLCAMKFAGYFSNIVFFVQVCLCSLPVSKGPAPAYLGCTILRLTLMARCISGLHLARDNFFIL